MPKVRCSECNFIQYKDAYKHGQWNRTDGLHFCLTCEAKHEKEGAPMRCNNCGTWKCSLAFSETYRHPANLTKRVCDDCDELRQCRGECQQYLSSKRYSKLLLRDPSCRRSQQFPGTHSASSYWLDQLR